MLGVWVPKKYVKSGLRQIQKQDIYLNPTCDCVNN